MKQSRNGGYSLIEILLAIVLLGAIMVPTCTSLVTAIRINDRTDEMMHAQLAVSSAVETLMAEGINAASEENVEAIWDVDVVVEDIEMELPYYKVTVEKAIEIDGERRVLASVDTYIRAGGGA